MALIVATPLLALASARSLERLGLAQKAIQSLSLAQRLDALRAATGDLIPPIRKRWRRLVPTLDLATVDASGMTGGAVATWDKGPATLVQDYLLTFGAGSAYTLTTSAGAFRSTADATVGITGGTWTGSILVDGYVLTLTGTITSGDVFAWSTSIVQDPGIALNVARMAAWILLGNRGQDPTTGGDPMKVHYDRAVAWAAALGIPGEGELDRTNDPPGGSQYGPLVTGDTSAYAWLDERSYDYGPGPYDMRH